MVRKSFLKSSGLVAALAAFALPGIALAQDGNGLGRWNGGEGRAANSTHQGSNWGERPAGARQQQGQVQPHEEHNWSGQGDGRTAWRNHEGNHARQVSPPAHLREGDRRWQGSTPAAAKRHAEVPRGEWSGRNHSYANPERNRTYANPERNRSYTDPYRRYSHSGGHRHWDNGWRHDRRYDWYGYRNHHRHAYHLGSYHAPYWGYGYQRIGIGFTLNSLFFGSRYWIADPWAYRLPPAYGPYRWVRYYDDVLLVDIYTGEVVDVIHGFFW